MAGRQGGSMKEIEFHSICEAIQNIAYSIAERSNHLSFSETDEAIRYGAERITHGLCIVAQSIERLARAFEKE